MRLANVDTPEKGQAGYDSARNALQRMIGGKEVSIDTKARDHYGRSVANVKVWNKSVNRAIKPERRLKDSTNRLTRWLTIFTAIILLLTAVMAAPFIRQIFHFYFPTQP